MLLINLTLQNDPALRVGGGENARLNGAPLGRLAT